MVEGSGGRYDRKTKKQLIEEMLALHAKFAELEKSAADAAIRDVAEQKRAEEALRDCEEMARGMLAAATTGMYFLRDGKILYVNRQFEEISGYKSDELTGTYPLDYVYPEDRETVRTKAIEMLKGQSSSSYEFRFVRKDSGIVWVSDRVASIQYRGKRSVLGSLMDITERKDAEAAEEELSRYTKHLEALFNIGVTVSRTLNLEELLDDVLDTVLMVMGVEVGGIFLLDQQTGKLQLRAHRGTSPEFNMKVEAVDLGGELIGQVAKSGKPILAEDVSADPKFSKMREMGDIFESFALVPIIAKEKVLAVMGLGSRKNRVFPDWEKLLLDTIANQIGMAIENAQLYEHALEIAFTDGLTGLYNRRYIMEQIEREFSRAQRSTDPLSLIMIDLDGLKTINDRFGHHEGDAFLKELAGIIKANTRASDVAARWGGDEFMLLAPGTDSGSASKIAERIRAQVECCKIKLEGSEVGVTISAGIVSYPAHASEVEALLKNVDEAMYNAKRGGKNQSSVYSP